MKTIERKPVAFTGITLKADANGKFPDVIELARVGEWHTPWHGDFILTIEDIDQAVEQFNAGLYRVNGTEPLAGTLDHNGGESPAAFRIERLFRDGEKLMAGVTWTKLGQEKLERDEYRYISFEYCPRSMPFENPEKAGDMWVNVVTGATLTNDPLFKNQKPIMASVKGGGETSNKGESMTIEDLRAKELADLSDEEKTFLKEHQADLSAEERLKFELETKEEQEAAEKAAKEEADRKAAEEQEAKDKAAKEAAEKVEAAQLEASTKGMTKEQKAAFATLQASVKDLQAKAEAGERAEKALLKNEMTAKVTAHVNRGAIKSGELESTVDMLMASTDAVRDSQLGFMDKLPGNPTLAKEVGVATVEASVTVTDEERSLGEAFGNSPEAIAEYKKSKAQG